MCNFSRMLAMLREVLLEKNSMTSKRGEREGREAIRL